MDRPIPLKKEHMTAYEVPCGIANRAPTCAAGGPYIAECDAGTGTVHLDGAFSADPDNDLLTFGWSTDCAGGAFSDSTSAAPDLSVSGPPACPVSCGATLVVSDPAGLHATCTASVTVADTIAPGITVPQRLKIDCTSHAPVPVTDPQIQAWLALAQGTDLCASVTMSNDATGPFPAFCKNTAGVDVVFTATDACGNATSALSSIKVVDETEPDLVAPPPLIVACPRGMPPGSDPAIKAWLNSATASDL